MKAQNSRNAWQQVKLKEVCREITVGHVGPMATQYIDEGIPFLRSQNIQPFHLDLSDIKYISEGFHARLRKSALHSGDVVVVRTGYPGTACVIPGSIRVANCADLVIIRPSEAIDPWFLACIFNSAWGVGTVAGKLVGVAQQHFNIGAAKEMIVNLPPLPVQRKIAAILSAYDDLIENNTRRIELLEEMARALYREWFVNFRFPGHERVRLVSSPLGKIPEGWVAGSLGEACNIVMGQSPKSEFYNTVGEGLPFHQGVTDFGARFPTDRVFCTVQNRLAERGDVLFSVRAPVGRINVANKRIVVGRGLCAIRNRRGNQWFTFHQLKERFQEEDTIGGGTIFKAVTKDDVQKIPFQAPEVGVASRFEELCKPIEAEVENLTHRNGKLRSTRDLLLPKLISGEVDVSRLDVRTEEASA